MRVCITGIGYVGLTTGVALAYLNHQVTGVDRDLDKLERVAKGNSPIYEPGLERMLGQVLGRRFEVDESVPRAVAEADVIMIAVGTPPKHNGEADLRHVEDAAREIARGLLPGRRYVVAVKSTVPIGTHRRVRYVIERTLAEREVDAKVYVASNPEFLREGRALRDMFYPDRIVVGAEEPEAIETLRRLYRPILEQTFDPPSYLPKPEGYALPPLVTMDPTSAELTKYASNAFLAIKISFINEIAALCERVGADVVEVARVVGLDSRIGPAFLQAGLGWGGSCLPKDTAALLAVASEHGLLMPLIEAARQVNFRQRQAVVDKLQSVLKGLRGRTVAVLGLAFKPGTDDVRDSPSLDVIRLLLERGAHVRVHDPVALSRAWEVLRDLNLDSSHDPYRVVQGSDAVIVATDWPEYRSLDLTKMAQSMRTPILIDGRNLFGPDEARKAGFVYMGVGR